MCLLSFRPFPSLHTFLNFHLYFNYFLNCWNMEKLKKFLVWRSSSLNKEWNITTKLVVSDLSTFPSIFICLILIECSLLSYHSIPCKCKTRSMYISMLCRVYFDYFQQVIVFYYHCDHQTGTHTHTHIYIYIYKYQIVNIS